MDLVLDNGYIKQNIELANLINNVRKEISDAILSAKVNRNYDKDVTLSFGSIHINPYGSVSEISFNGIDVVDVDKFIITTALKVDSNNYFDLRDEIESNISDFDFYPIKNNGKVFLTVLKSSSYFERFFNDYLFGNKNITVKYALKYIIFEVENGKSKNSYVFLVGLFNPEITAKKILKEAGRSVSTGTELYYAFFEKNLLKAGQCKRDFNGYQPRKGLNFFDFYKGTVESAIFYSCVVRDSNSKIKMKETKRNAFKNLIETQYGSIHDFCDTYEIDERFATSYFAGISNSIQYKNGNTLTPTRLEEMLNITIDTSEDGLKEKNLLIKIKYEDIPDGIGTV